VHLGIGEARIGAKKEIYETLRRCRVTTGFKTPPQLSALLGVSAAQGGATSQIPKLKPKSPDGRQLIGSSQVAVHFWLSGVAVNPKLEPKLEHLDRAARALGRHIEAVEGRLPLVPCRQRRSSAACGRQLGCGGTLGADALHDPPGIVRRIRDKRRKRAWGIRT
jgi:hypothetical protein